LLFLLYLNVQLTKCYWFQFGSFAGVSLVMLSGIASNSMDGAKIWERDAKFYVGK